MLPAEHRMRSSAEFAAVVRRGRRATRGTLTVQVLDGLSRDELALGPARVGFVVSKAVGGSVVRHTVARRLRHVVRERLDVIPGGTGLVVRASSSAAGVPSDRLGADLDAALARLGHR